MVDDATDRDNRRRFFEEGVEQIREMRSRVEAMAANAVNAGLPDTAFDDLRAVLDRQGKSFQDQADSLAEA